MKQKFYLIFIWHLLFQISGKAQWNGDPVISDNPVSTASYSESNPHCIPDGKGGVISIFNTYSGVAAQHITASGASVWSVADNPRPVLNGIAGIIYDAIPDGKGGAFISLQQFINDSVSNVYVQHIKSDGSLPFGVQGIRVNPVNNHFNTDIKICADSNGITVAWSEEVREKVSTPPVFSVAQVFVQRYDLSGNPQWGNSGLAVSVATGSRSTPELIGDNNGGAFIAFTDYRNANMLPDGSYDNPDIYAQHISANGSRLWGTTDVVITNDSLAQSVYMNYYPLPAKSMVSDGAGGFLIVYASAEFVITNPKLYVQHVSGDGELLFPQSILLSSNNEIEKPYLHLVSDGAHGVVAAWGEWGEQGNMVSNYVKAQRLSGTGSLLWGARPLTIGPPADENFSRNKIAMASDDSGNYIFVWHSGDFFGNKLRGQKLNNLGEFQWSQSGVDICANLQAQPGFPDLAPSDSNNMIIMWNDQRNYATTGFDIFAAKLGPGGVLAVSPAKDFYTIGDGNWDNPAIWSGGQVPAPDANVTIHNKISVNINASCNSVTIESPGELTVNAGVNFSVLH